MSKAGVLERLRAERVIPVIRTRSVQQAATVVAWLIESGCRSFEITLTVPGAIPLIRELAGDPALLLGAGTVPDAREAQAAIEAGARFIVAPWVDSSLRAPCAEADALLMLGAYTPTEVRAAIAAGTDVVKIFPAGNAGGPGYIRALRSVLPRVPLCPTGGIEPRDVQGYLAAGANFVGMGGALVDVARIEAGDRAAIQSVARQVFGASESRS